MSPCRPILDHKQRRTGFACVSNEPIYIQLPGIPRAGGRNDMAPKFHYFARVGEPGKPAGTTVSKTGSLPDGQFRITEYTWRTVSLWFINQQNFTADERQYAHCEFHGMCSDEVWKKLEARERPKGSS